MKGKQPNPFVVFLIIIAIGIITFAVIKIRTYSGKSIETIESRAKKIFDRAQPDIAGSGIMAIEQVGEYLKIDYLFFPLGLIKMEPKREVGVTLMPKIRKFFANKKNEEIDRLRFQIFGLDMDTDKRIRLWRFDITRRTDTMIGGRNPEDLIKNADYDLIAKEK